MKQNKLQLVCLIAVLGLLFATPSLAQDKWYPRVIARGSDKETIKSLPIEQRPNRPLHFYGNTVRRRVHRFNPRPMSIDIFRSPASLIRWR